METGRACWSEVEKSRRWCAPPRAFETLLPTAARVPDSATRASNIVCMVNRRTEKKARRAAAYGTARFSQRCSRFPAPPLPIRAYEKVIHKMYLPEA